MNQQIPAISAENIKVGMTFRYMQAACDYQAAVHHISLMEPGEVVRIVRLDDKLVYYAGDNAFGTVAYSNVGRFLAPVEGAANS